MDADSTFAKWDGWLTTIHREVFSLALNRYVFKEVNNIVSQNPKLHVENIFYDWMWTNYAAAATVAVRRQVDPDKRTVSLLRLLMDIERHPEVLSRARYVSLAAQRRGVSRRDANGDFDRLVGRGRTCIDRAKVARDRQMLEAQAENTKNFVNKRIAHTDQSPLKNRPRFKDLHGCVDFLERLVLRYVKIIRARGELLELLPSEGDWRAIFRRRWID